jgi:hypothetical protein
MDIYVCVYSVFVLLCDGLIPRPRNPAGKAHQWAGEPLIIIGYGGPETAFNLRLLEHFCQYPIPFLFSSGFSH